MKKANFPIAKGKPRSQKQPPEVFFKKGVLKFSQILRESTCVGVSFFNKVTGLFHDGCSYHVETSPLTGRANQWIGFYMIETSVIKDLTLTSTLTLS